ncbi:HAMP domain-containing sensor histidine kinase [Catellatospora sp. NPDC049609]|uniref:sensor histidine kinase n=1 Tax=Catellatospora sp. NPDC049609 TaxID=3155505 RepID=UPI003439A928
MTSSRAAAKPGAAPRRGPRTLLVRLAARTALVGLGFFLAAGAAVVAVAAHTTSAQVEERLRVVGAALRGPAAPSGPQLCRLIAAPPSGLPVPPDATVELHGPAGQVCRAPGRPALQSLNHPSALLGWLTGSRLPHARTEDGTPTLVLTEQLPDGWTAHIAADLTGYTVLSDRLLTTLLLLGLPGAVVATVAGYALTRNGLQPVRDLAAAAETIAATQNLSVPATTAGSRSVDEVTRLADAFNRMIAALADARIRQSQLIADAGHELRTPLTSLRANIELLLRSERAGRTLPPQARLGLLADLTAQVDELVDLCDQLDVLWQEHAVRPRGDVCLDEIVRRAVSRVGRRSADHLIVTDLSPWTVPDADADGLERAVLNVLDNAVKFAPPGSRIRVLLAGGRITVDDQGPGVPAAQREVIFGRFWRADDARGLPGSGLGLAIVADVVHAHHGCCFATAAPGGGLRVVIQLGGHPTQPASVPS